MKKLHHIDQPPSVGDTDPEPPMVVFLHGYGSNEGDLMGLSPYLDRRLITVSARAPISLDFGGYAWFPIEVTDNGITLQLDQVADCLEAIRTLVRELKVQYHPGKVFLLGFSQGASMALSSAFSDPGMCDGVAALSGVVIPEMLPADPDLDLNGLPVIMTHGRRDELIPIAQGRSSHGLLQTMHLSLSYHEYDMGHEINQACLTEVGNWLTRQIDDAYENEESD